MAHDDQFENLEDAASSRPAACIVCETMLPEAVDGALSAAEQRVFDAHVAGCTTCSMEFAEAQRGAAWLGMLKSTPPEPPAHLLAKILAETSGASQSVPVAAQSVPATAQSVPATAQSLPVTAPAPQPIPARQWALPTIPKPSFGARLAAFRRSFSSAFSMENAQSVFQPRLAMTSAMAFFSIALTLNLTGVRLRDVRAENFTPSGIKRTVADTTASLTRSFQNNRSVYEVESRLNEINQDDAVQREGRPGR